MDGPARASTLDRARRLGLAAVAVLAIGLTAGASGQILWAVFSPPGAGEAAACRTGVVALLTGIERARWEAAGQGGGERTALAVFRRALEPEWSHAAAIENRCRRDGDREALRAFRQVELLRYAEERAVRYEALDLSLLRRRAPDLARSLAPK